MSFRQISLLLGAGAVAAAAAQIWGIDAKGVHDMHTLRQETLHRRATCVWCVLIGLSKKLHKYVPGLVTDSST
jgi:hypothetical protein